MLDREYYPALERWSSIIQPINSAPSYCYVCPPLCILGLLRMFQASQPQYCKNFISALHVENVTVITSRIAVCRRNPSYDPDDEQDIGLHHHLTSNAQVSWHWLYAE